MLNELYEQLAKCVSLRLKNDYYLITMLNLVNMESCKMDNDCIKVLKSIRDKGEITLSEVYKLVSSVNLIITIIDLGINPNYFALALLMCVLEKCDLDWEDYTNLLLFDYETDNGVFNIIVLNLKKKLEPFYKGVTL